MLLRLRVKNFRLLKDVTLELGGEGPWVLVGPNASGKSTLLEVIDFLARCGQDGLQKAAEAHGGIRSMRSAGTTEPIEIESSWAFMTSGEESTKRGWILVWHLSLGEQPNGAVRVINESLANTHMRRTDIVSTEDGKRIVAPDREDQGKPSELRASHELSFEALVDMDRFPALGFLRALLAECAVMGALPTAPAWARDEAGGASLRDSLVIGPRRSLSRQGLGLATMLYNIFTEHPEEWSALETAFRGEFPFVKRLVFPPDAGGSRISFAFEDKRFPGRKFYASEMSDGMVAYLCLLAALLNPSQRGVLALDEPDSHLHPSALRRFMSLAHRPHGKRALIMATHSNALLDELKDPAKSIRIVEANSNGAVIRKLDPEALASWRQEYSLSEMRRTGLIDHTNSDYGSDE